MHCCFLGEACGVCWDYEETADLVDGKRKMPILVAFDDVKGCFLDAKGSCERAD